MSFLSQASLTDEFDDLKEEYETLVKQNQVYKEKLADLKKIQSKCLSLLSHQNKKYKQLRQALEGSDSSLSEEDAALEKKITERQKSCRSIQENLPKPNSFLLNVIVGQISLSLLTKAEKYDYKQGYEQFKLYTTIIMLVYSLVNLFIVQYRFIDAIYHFMIVWYYCTLVLRENILRHNGSRIKGWWVIHHYLTVLLSGILLIWPDSISYRMFRTQFMVFGVYLNFLQLLQYYYQSGCLYRLRALGEKSDMDITVAEEFQAWMWRGLTFLLPFLFFGYLFQLYNAITLYYIANHPDCQEWMVSSSAVIFFILFLGNSSTLSKVVIDKFKSKGSKTKAA
ncbi:transmembrane protein 120A-like isoform X2 [Apostichopus japonicus]|uniref:transmembrane protein 120A-like isoform X2 n=1 Tax=Stichopus japonicus TaxID=307972 RepID=UPI003AB524BF